MGLQPLIIALLLRADVVLGRVLGEYTFQQYEDCAPKFRAAVALTEQDVNLMQIVTSLPKHDMMIESANAFLLGLYSFADAEREKTLSGSVKGLGNTWQPPDDFVWTRGEYLPNLTEFGPPEHAPQMFSNDSDGFNDGMNIFGTRPSITVLLQRQAGTSHAESEARCNLGLKCYDFCQSLYPLVQGTLDLSQLNYGNAYLIWDLFNSDFIRNHDMYRSTSNHSLSAIMQTLSDLAYRYELDLVRDNLTVRQMGG
ncbi:hypothetical protein N7490_003175 [Penicillium lividum]|nr:hypothetical protein N7490_003175 [Penicillium lividum]